MLAYAEKKTLPSHPTHSVKRLYRRTNKIDAAEFKVKKENNRPRPRAKHIEQELDEWLIQTFSNLYKKQRYDQHQFTTKEALIHEGLRRGIAIKKIFFSLELLLNEAQISEYKIRSKDIWIFALYQVLRGVERKLHQDRHIYTSQTGKRNSEITMMALNQLIPGWRDPSGKISKTLQ